MMRQRLSSPGAAMLLGGAALVRLSMLMLWSPSAHGFGPTAMRVPPAAPAASSSPRSRTPLSSSLTFRHLSGGRFDGRSTCSCLAFTPLFAAAGGGSTDIPNGSEEEDGGERDADADDEVQWDLFLRHHARGSWRGTWTTYDYMGDVVDSTPAAVVLNRDEEEDDGENVATVTQTHEIVVGSVKSDCETCFDSDNVRVLPVARYGRGSLRRQRLGSVGMVNGPTVLRSGAMSTELVLAHGDGRVRVVFQHAPAWERGVDPASGGPPSGLKLFRTIVSREALRPIPPSRESEGEDPPGEGDPKFFRPVPPFLWHKKWEGTSWTWGPTRGDQGWKMDDMEEIDAWHGRPTGDSANVWSMRLPGGILLQCPRVIGATGDGGAGEGRAELMRLAWLPEDERLVRLEASVFAMDRPIADPNTGDVVGFYPPTLGSLRCDTLRKAGELEGVSLLEREREAAAAREAGDRSDGDGDMDGAVEPRVDDEAQLAP